MIVDLEDTTTTEVSKRLLRLRQEVGAMATGRVLTLALLVDADGLDDAVAAAGEATRQHPARIVALVPGDGPSAGRLDAQIRVGGDAGASEIVILRITGPLGSHLDRALVPLLLPDSPLVAWWPGEAPADVAADTVGAMAGRRITDAAAVSSPRRDLGRRHAHHAPGDTDLAWTRLTRWRGLLASSLDEAPFAAIERVTVEGAPDSPEADLMAGWLADRLGVPVTRRRVRDEDGDPIGDTVHAVTLHRTPLTDDDGDTTSSDIDLRRDGADSTTATLQRGTGPARQVALTEPRLTALLSEELRRLDPDETYASALAAAVDTGDDGLVTPRAVRT